MLADKWYEPNLGGGPEKNLPMRSEHFTYTNNEDISDRERIISQGRINPDTKRAGSKYWGSFL